MHFGQWKRREVITLLGVGAAWPLAARAQQPGRLRTIGFLGAGSPTTAGVWVSAFASRLRELGWIEDRNIKIDVRWAEGRDDRSAELAILAGRTSYRSGADFLKSRGLALPHHATRTLLQLNCNAPPFRNSRSSPCECNAFCRLAPLQNDSLDRPHTMRRNK
jgi:hypothetical protein